MFSILVVEDDMTLNKMISAKLKKENYQVFSSFDGQQALDIMDKNHIDLIISDIMMPNKNGYELVKELRNASYMLPILMVTAKDQMEDMEKGFMVGSDDYMIKPINMKEMVLRVKALLRRAQIANEKR
ncbi:winged helix family two component transcriptional regulator [Clostridium sartagoforme AAU1]|uniref:Stage 0 sporulation protein A homolog n=1 Tax=Clostridium sartagoforme AAU1 TaxID=1202534 RepID=R9C1D8_9CLOT|nr:winged helix family two component transcriptional regulator [Clostridium sartagoforme AAU1]